MKTQFLVLILFISQIISVSAQMDDKFYYPRKDLKSVEWTNYEELKFPVEKDTLSVLLLKPTKKIKATVFYFHGAGGNNTYYLPLIHPLLVEGYQVVMTDFRGYGNSTGIPTHLNIAEDGQKVFDELIKRKDIKDTHKIIFGASMGTQIATLLAERNQNKINGLVLDGPISSFGDIAGFYTPEFKEYLEKSYISPYSAKENIKSIQNIPILIIHSKEDKEVPFEQGMIVFSNANSPKEFFEYSGEHLQGILLESSKILSKMNEMLEK